MPARAREHLRLAGTCGSRSSPLIGRIPLPDQPAGEPGSRPPRVAGFLCLQSPRSEPTDTPRLMSAFDAVDGSIHRHIGATAVGCG